MNNLRTERKTGAAFPSPYKFKRHGQSGTEVSEIFPHTAECIDDIAVIRSMHADVPNHEPSLMLMNCGEARLIRPSVGSWVTYGLGSENNDLPAFVVMHGTKPRGADPIWSAGFSPSVYQATALDPRQAKPIANLERPQELSGVQQRSLLDALRRENQRHAEERPFDRDLNARLESFELAYRMQAAAPEAFDVSSESEATREKYGKTLNGTSMLLARRLAEARVPFITVFWNEDPKLAPLCKGAGGWDTHGNNFNCLEKYLLPEFDRGFAALLDDLHERGLLDSTLVMVSSEMGRKPKVGDPRSGGVKGAGRDHWTHAMSVLLAGGGIRGGQVYGSSDKIAAYPDDKPVAPEDIAKTVYRVMGVDDVFGEGMNGQPEPILEHGRVLTELF